MQPEIIIDLKNKNVYSCIDFINIHIQLIYTLYHDIH